MVAMTKYQIAVENMWAGVHNFEAAGHAINVVIVDSADTPVAGTDDQLADITQITGTGYAAVDTQNDLTRSGGTASWTGVDSAFAPGAETDWTEGRWLALYNDTATGDPLIGFYDYGAGFTLGAGETMTLDFGTEVGTLA